MTETANIIPLHRLIAHQSWQHIQTSDMTELAQFADSLNISAAFLEKVQDPDEIPHLERKGEQRFVLLLAPRMQHDMDAPLYVDTVPIGIVLHTGGVATIGNHPLPLWQRLQKRFERRSESPFKAERFLAQLYLELAKDFYHSLDMVDKQLKLAKESLRNSQSNQQFFRLLSLQKSLIYVTSALQSDLATGERLMHSTRWHGSDIDNDQLQDALSDFLQARETAKLMAKLITNTMDAFAGTLQNNISAAIRTVTAWTVIITVPIAVISVMAMNTPTPGRHWLLAWPVLMGGSFLVSGLLYWFLRRWHWL